MNLPWERVTFGNYEDTMAFVDDLFVKAYKDGFFEVVDRKGITLFSSGGKAAYESHKGDGVDHTKAAMALAEKECGEKFSAHHKIIAAMEVAKLRRKHDRD